MFQNISKDYTEENENINVNKKNIIDILKNTVNIKSILLYVISFMLSCTTGMQANFSATPLLGAKRVSQSGFAAECCKTDENGG